MGMPMGMPRSTVGAPRPGDAVGANSGGWVEIGPVCKTLTARASWGTWGRGRRNPWGPKGLRLARGVLVTELQYVWLDVTSCHHWGCVIASNIHIDHYLPVTAVIERNLNHNPIDTNTL